MAGHWGSSWGAAWGATWDFLTAQPPPASGGVGGGGGSAGAQHHRRLLLDRQRDAEAAQSAVERIAAERAAQATHDAEELRQREEQVALQAAIDAHAAIVRARSEADRAARTAVERQQATERAAAVRNQQQKEAAQTPPRPDARIEVRQAQQTAPQNAPAPTASPAHEPTATLFQVEPDAPLVAIEERAATQLAPALETQASAKTLADRQRSNRNRAAILLALLLDH